MTPDLDAARSFLLSLFLPTGGPVELTAIRDGRVVTDFCLGGDALADELDDALPDMADANAQGWHVYFRCSTLRTTAVDGRGGEAASWRLPGFWCDTDQKRTGEDLGTMYKRLHRFAPQPSVMWATGGGMQAAWLFHEPLDAFDYLTHWKAVNKGLQQAVDSDSVANADRLLRLPGFINHKYEDKPRAMLLWQAWGTRYVPADFEPFRPQEPKRQVRVPLPDTVRLNVPEWIQDYMQAPPAPGERNNTLFRIAATLKDFGWPIGDVLQMFEGFAGLPLRETQTTISSAFDRPRRGVRPTLDIVQAMRKEEWNQ